MCILHLAIRPSSTSSRHIISRRGFHTTPCRSSSPLFHLAALSNARESRHFKKASKLSQVEHSPALQLIRSSEVEPFGGPRHIEDIQTKSKAGDKPTIAARESRGWLRSGDSAKKVEAPTRTSPIAAASSETPVSPEEPRTRRGLSEAAAQEVGRVAEVFFPSRRAVSEDNTTSNNADAEPWKHFGITEAEYTAFQSLEEGGSSSALKQKQKSQQAQANKFRMENFGKLAEDVTPPDEPLWGPGSDKTYPLGASDAEYMANVMQFRERRAAAEEAAMIEAAETNSAERAAVWTPAEIELLQKVYKEEKPVSSWTSAETDVLKKLEKRRPGKPSLWTPADLEMLKKLDQEGKPTAALWASLKKAQLNQLSRQSDRASSPPWRSEEEEMLKNTMKQGQPAASSAGDSTRKQTRPVTSPPADNPNSKSSIGSSIGWAFFGALAALLYTGYSSRSTTASPGSATSSATSTRTAAPPTPYASEEEEVATLLAQLEQQNSRRLTMEDAVRDGDTRKLDARTDLEELWEQAVAMEVDRSAAAAATHVEQSVIVEKREETEKKRGWSGWFWEER